MKKVLIKPIKNNDKRMLFCYGNETDINAAIISTIGTGVVTAVSNATNKN